MDKKVFSETQIIMFGAFIGLALLILLPVSSKVFKVNHEIKYEQNIDVLIDASKNWINDNGVDTKNYYIPIDYLIKYQYLSDTSITGCVKVLYNDVTGEYSYNYFNNVCDELISFKDLLLSKIVVIGDGLYKEDGKYIFEGKDPKNYILIDNLLYRIVSIDDSGIKIITDSSIDNKKYDSKRNEEYCGKSGLGCNIYMADGIKVFDNSELYEYLENAYKIPSVAVDTTWNLGLKSKIDDVISADSVNNTSKIGLISIDEYILANNNGNWLNNNEDYWTSTGYKLNDNEVWYITSNGEIGRKNANDSIGVRPVININSNFKVNGDGSKINPYVIK